jgi:hypothetical protein
MIVQSTGVKLNFKNGSNDDSLSINTSISDSTYSIAAFSLTSIGNSSDITLYLDDHPKKTVTLEN